MAFLNKFSQLGSLQSELKKAARTSAADVPTTEPDSTSHTTAGVSETPSFPTIYEKYFDFVWTSARGLGVDANSIDDIVQEVFIVIHARLNTLRDPTALRSWIYGIVRRTALSQIRAQRTRDAYTLMYGENSVRASGMLTPSDDAEQSDQTKLLWTLLERLDEPKRELFVMAELAEMTMPEIARTLDIPVGTASTRLRAARKAFEAALARHKANQKRGGDS